MGAGSPANAIIDPLTHSRVNPLPQGHLIASGHWINWIRKCIHFPQNNNYAGVEYAYLA
ncbi:conserved protein of unknown function [Pseudomonas inefficax]|uniref:Uncharacterized protein n=1 Tax=Pseudomonas inefficax TaxID=2078786 RepID=A0AAQ1P5B9_9PSED|nr:conserved protein of unknown function [Pseudomonas inefficax]